VVLSGDNTVTTAAFPDVTPPAIVLGPSIVAVGDTWVIVEWTTNEPASDELKAGTTSGVYPLTVSGTGQTTGHILTLTGLTADTDYFFVTESTDIALNGPTQSAEDTFKTLAAPDTTAPLFVDGPWLIGKTDTTATFRWVTDEATTGELQYGPDTGYGFTRAVTSLRREHWVTLTGLAPDSDMHVRVAAVDSESNGPVVSGDLTVRTMATPDTTPPAIDLASVEVVYLSDTRAVVVWSTNEPATSEVRVGVTAPGEITVSSPDLRLSHEVVVSGLTPATGYKYRLFSQDPVGNVTQTPEGIFVTTGADAILPVISNEAAEFADSDRAVIVWNTDEPTTFDLDHGPDTGYGVTITGGAASTSHRVVITGLTASTTWHAQITARDLAGNTTMSADLAIPPGAAPDATPPAFVAPPTAVYDPARGIVVTFATDENTQASLESGTTPAGGTFQFQGFTLSHEFVTEAVFPSTTTLRIRVADAANNVNTYELQLPLTLPKDKKKCGCYWSGDAPGGDLGGLAITLLAFGGLLTMRRIGRMRARSALAA
jgi:hypothetical protein